MTAQTTRERTLNTPSRETELDSRLKKAPYAKHPLELLREFGQVFWLLDAPRGRRTSDATDLVYQRWKDREDLLTSLLAIELDSFKVIYTQQEQEILEKFFSRIKRQFLFGVVLHAVKQERHHQWLAEVTANYGVQELFVDLLSYNSDQRKAVHRINLHKNRPTRRRGFSKKADISSEALYLAAGKLADVLQLDDLGDFVSLR